MQGHKLVLSTASPVFHQLFYPAEGGPEVPDCLALSRGQAGAVSRLEITGIPPVAVESLLEYSYKDR